MQYLTGIHALNLPCELKTCGDWHMSALAWKDLFLRNTQDSVFGDWGLEYNKCIPEHMDEYFVVANHIRALLDLLECGQFGVAGGMREDFICNEEYTVLVFNKVLLLKKLPHWGTIKEFMLKEYKLDWVKFCEVNLV